MKIVEGVEYIISDTSYKGDYSLCKGCFGVFKKESRYTDYLSFVGNKIETCPVHNSRDPERRVCFDVDSGVWRACTFDETQKITGVLSIVGEI